MPEAPKDKPTPAPDDSAFSIEDWLAGATRPETVISLSSKGREYGEYRAKEVELMKAERAAADNPDDRLVTASGNEPARIAREMDALAKVIDSGMREFRFRGLDEEHDLKAVRDAKDKENLDEEGVAAVMMSLCCIDPVMTPAQWKAARSALGEGQWNQATRTANTVTFGEAVTVPFSVAASVAAATNQS